LIAEYYNHILLVTFLLENTYNTCEKEEKNNDLLLKF